MILPEQTRSTTGSAIIGTSERMLETIHQKAGVSKIDEIMVGPAVGYFG
jgi:hypothetical protein